MADEKTFDLLKTLQGRAYPEDEVTVYLDGDGIYRLAQIREELTEHADPKKKAYKDLEAEAEKLAKSILETELTFKLRGVAPGVVSLLVEKYQKEEAFEALQDELLAATLVSVVDAKGAEDRRKFSVEDCKEIRHMLPQAAYVQISNKVTDLNMNAAIYDQTVDSGFLQKP